MVTFAAADHAEVTAAVTQAERSSDAEIVTVVSEKSDSYHDVGLHYAVLAMLLVPALLALIPQRTIDWMSGLFLGWNAVLSRGALMAALFVATGLILGGRAVHISLVEDERYQVFAAEQGGGEAPAATPIRGSIVSADGRELATSLELLDQRVYSGVDASRIIAGAKTRRDLVLDDQAGQCIGDDRLEPVTDLDPDFALVRRNQQNNAVIGPFLSDSPRPAQAVPIVLDRIALQVRHRHNHELSAAGLLQGLEPPR
jgi:hypothetical protein